MPESKPVSATRRSRGFPLRLLLIVPFTVQTFVAVGLTGWLSLRNGQRAVNDVASQLRQELTARIDQQLTVYLDTPHTVNAITVEAIRRFDLWNPQDMSALQSYLLWQLQQFPAVSYISFGGEQTEYAGAGRKANGTLVVEITDQSTNFVNTISSVDATGQPTGSQETYPDYDPRVRPWYLNAKAADAPVWNDIYQYYIEANLGISTSRPYRDRNNILRGVVSTDMYLIGISDFLRQLSVGSTGETFILDRAGFIVASSTTEPPFQQQAAAQEAARLLATASQEPLIRETSAFLLSQFGDLAPIRTSQQLEFRLAGERQFVQVAPFTDGRGLDWLIVVVVPEADFMAEIQANTRLTIALCLLALAIAIGLGLWTSQWIARPILRLNQASRAIAAGQLDQTVTIQGVQELATLSDSFNQMAHQLATAFADLEVRVTERTAQLQEAKAAAEVANQAKSEFLANMSHELRTPLNAILGFTQMLKHQFSLDYEQRNYLDIISRSGEHLLNLINDVLDMSKIEAGRATLDLETVNLYQLLSTLNDMFQLRAETKGIQLTVSHAAMVPRYIQTDERKLQQILINLLGNALKFTQHGHVSLVVTPAASPPVPAPTNPTAIALHFAVTDTGPGINAAELEAIFDPFVQAQTGQPASQGTGLGLSISRQFVQLLGGELTVQSTVGQGTCFEFDLTVPCVEANDLPVALPKQRVIGLHPGQPQYRILIVDDRWENRYLIVRLLAPLGLEIQEADQGQAAVTLWQIWHPHLIWMDMRMPILDGYAATRQIRALEQADSTATATKIIALTASAYEEERSIVLAIGCDDFVRKPFSEEILFNKMAQHLGLQYEYEALTPPAAAELSPHQAQAALAQTPAEWRQELYQAAQTLSAARVLAVIDTLPPTHQDLAAQLRQLVRNFRYDIMIDWIQRASEV